METQGLQATPEQADRLHHFAHDLRNRLGGMQQILRMLGAPEPGMDAAELVEFAEQQYFKAMRLTEELLDDLMVERGTPALTISPVDLSAIVSSSMQLMESRFAKKSQRIVVEGPRDILVQAEPRHLEQLITALLSNSSKFSAAGATVRIVLGTADSQAFAEVVDTGVGLDATDLELVFERYAILSSRSTAGEDQGRSTLSRARQWARAMGGELSATSEGAGSGCTFRISLPKA